MKANNISISIPYKGCDKSCPYCVSKMTGYMKSDNDLFKINASKARKMADTTGVTGVSITGKGEPTLNFDMVNFVCHEFRDYPIEIQTNGLAMLKNPTLVDRLSLAGIDIFAISMDKPSDFELLKPVINRIKDLNKTVRVTLNVTDMLPNPSVIKFTDYIDYCKEYGIDQFSLRQITIANFTEINEVHNWIMEHTYNHYYADLIDQFKTMKLSKKIVQFLRSLSYGAELYDVDGISFTYFDYCIQDSSNGDDIRSLIYMEDGHLYTSWNSLASRIF